jgi:hypothetical protein
MNGELMTRFRLLFVWMLFVAVPVFAQYTMTPSHGPVAGGTEITITGSFSSPSGYRVGFGNIHVPATRVSETTLVATTPPHLPGAVGITITELDMVKFTNLQFTYEGDAGEAYDRFLLPVFTYPIRGAFGSEFRTDLTGRLVQNTSVDIWGLWPECHVTCIFPDFPTTLTLAAPDLAGLDRTGTPGVFIYVPKGHADRVALNLRASDTSRSAENFGTELPIVPARDFVSGYASINLVGIPSDPRFRNTLRVYAYGEDGAALIVTIDGDNVHVEKRLTLPPMDDNFHPGYVELSDFPVNAGMLRVRIDVDVPAIGAEFPTPDRWGFVSVTNNVTQHITLVTPQRR